MWINQLQSVHNMPTTVLSGYKINSCEVKHTGQSVEVGLVVGLDLSQSPTLQAQAWYRPGHAET